MIADTSPPCHQAVLHQQVQSDLEQAPSKGTAAFVTFVDDQLIKNILKFLDPITKMQMKTFRSLSVKKKVRAGHICIKLFRSRL